MSVQAMAWAWQQKLTKKPPAKAVLVALANFADESGECFPGQERLMEMTELSRASVIRAVEFLQEAGLVTVERRTRANGPRRSSRHAEGRRVDEIGRAHV